MKISDQSPLNNSMFVNKLIHPYLYFYMNKYIGCVQLIKRWGHLIETEASIISWDW